MGRLKMSGFELTVVQVFILMMVILIAQLFALIKMKKLIYKMDDNIYNLLISLKVIKEKE